MKDIIQILAEQGGARKSTITKDGKYDIIFIATMLANMVTSDDRETVLNDFMKLNDKMAFLSGEYAEALSSEFQNILQSYKDQQDSSD